MAAVIATVAGLAPALAADPAGEAIAVTPAAAASGAAGSRTLATHGSVFMGDLVTTDAGGQAQLKFLDDTRMVVGPNSELTIDKFVYAGDGTAKQVTLEATRGVFRFITGNSPKPAYLIDTPVATIGARGSHGDFILPGDGTLSVVYYSEQGVGPDEHGLYVCDKPSSGGRHCVELTKECSFVTFGAGPLPVFTTNAYERARKMDAIGFAFNRGIAGDDFRVNSGPCNSREDFQPSNLGQDEPLPPEREPPPVEDCEECDY
jgi:FecR protein